MAMALKLVADLAAEKSGAAEHGDVHQSFLSIRSAAVGASEPADPDRRHTAPRCHRDVAVGIVVLVSGYAGGKGLWFHCS